VDGRDKPGHDEEWGCTGHSPFFRVLRASMVNRY